MEGDNNALEDREANNARVLQTAINELRKRASKALADKTFGELTVKIQFKPGQLGQVESGTLETYR
jgi:hypothetical protein